MKIMSIIRLQLLAAYRKKKRKKIMSQLPMELDEYEKNLLCEVYLSGFTMEPLARLVNTALTVIHVIQKNTQGDYVECGVFKGGQGILAAGIFINRRQNDRKVFLFDTYSGAPKPGIYDSRISNGELARHKWAETNGNWMNAGLREVKSNFAQLGVSMDNVRFVKGDVRETLYEKENIPGRISVLRLDTNQYDSVKVEMDRLYPILSKGGILVINDYGFWAGTKKAVDEYFMFNHDGLEAPFFIAVDTAARFGVKT